MNFMKRFIQGELFATYPSWWTQNIVASSFWGGIKYLHQYDVGKSNRIIDVYLTIADFANIRYHTVSGLLQKEPAGAAI